MELLTFFFSALLAFATMAAAMPASDNNKVLGVTRIGTHEEMLKVKERIVQKRQQELDANCAVNGTTPPTRANGNNETSSLTTTFNTNTNPPNVNKDWTVRCDKPAAYLNPEYLEVLTVYWSDWCDAGNHIWPSQGYYADFGEVRVSVCNFGWWNPCSSGEMRNAWARIDDWCPATDDGKKPVAGYWTEPDWAKSYERTHCRDAKVCDRSNIDCNIKEIITSVPISPVG